MQVGVWKDYDDRGRGASLFWTRGAATRRQRRGGCSFFFFIVLFVKKLLTIFLRISIKCRGLEDRER